MIFILLIFDQCFHFFILSFYMLNPIYKNSFRLKKKLIKYLKYKLLNVDFGLTSW